MKKDWATPVTETLVALGALAAIVFFIVALLRLTKRQKS